MSGRAVEPSGYAPLWCKSHFSFLEGASQPAELVDRAADLGLAHLALTDRDGVYGVVEAHVQARERGLRLIPGAEVSVEDDSRIVLLARDREGYANLCRLITRGRLRSVKGQSVVTWAEVAEHAGGVVALWGGEPSLLTGQAEPLFAARLLKEAFGERLLALAVRHGRAEEVRMEARLRQRAARYELPVVAGVEVLYHHRARRDLQDVLTCLRHKVKLATAGRLLRANAGHALRSPAAMARLFADDPAALRQSRIVAEQCTFSLDQLRYRYPSERLPDGTTSGAWLRSLTLEGARRRFGGNIASAMRAQLDRELALIHELDYDGYFLTMWEIVQFCRSERILCQGRGSAANSAVCYCLGITAVDPVQMGLLFERFISRERAEPPDIDLDIEHGRREEVIQHVYRKYGRTHAAMVANLVRYRGRSAVRDVGKVLGVAETSLDRLARMVSYHGPLEAAALEHAGLDPAHPVHRHLLRLATEIQDVPRHLSIHPGGFLLGHEPVHDIVPIENASMSGRTVIQWDKESIEALNLFKVDLLGLGALHQLHLAFDLLETHHGERRTLATLPPDDPETFDQICRADTVGVFQIESRAQMAMLPRLKPRCYYDLVIEVSLVRPGPITGGMVHPYLRRRAGLEPVTYPHPCLEPVLKKTLGVPLFQEQVIRLAMVAADYSPGEADQLRRDMAAWRHAGRIERHRDRLVSRMQARGILLSFAVQVFDQIRGFGEYGFPESHAASFALIAYATAWMKCHHPEVFLCSLLNAQPMGFYSPATLIEDGRRHRVEVRPVDVQASAWDCTLEATPGAAHPFAVRLGLRMVKGLRKDDALRLVARRASAPFTSPEEVADRTGLNDGALTRLAEAGAFSSLEPARRRALWQVAGLGRSTPPALALHGEEPGPELPELEALEEVAWDHMATGSSARGHPLAFLRETLRARGLPDAATVSTWPHGRRVRYAGLVICRQRPSTARGVVFMTLEDETGFVNLVVWKPVFERNAVLLKTEHFLGVTGRLQVQDKVVHLVAEQFWIPDLEPDLFPLKSRDFQ